MANSQSEHQKSNYKCTKCPTNDHDVHLHAEIESLKQKLLERDDCIATMETNFLNDTYTAPSEELNSLKEELSTWQDKYKRLYEAHRRIQRVNQGLEDKLLKLVDVCETDKSILTKDIATLSQKLAEANYTVKKLMEDNERYRSDVALAIQFLQCNQSNFVSRKINTLPNEVQAKVSSYVAGKKKPEEKQGTQEVKNVKVPIPTFPPTAMVYSIPKSSSPEKEQVEPENQSEEVVSAAVMAKILEERERERALMKHCDTCTCSKKLKIIYDVTQHSIGIQTHNAKMSLCLKCNADVENQELNCRNAIKLVQNLDDNQRVFPCDNSKFILEDNCDKGNQICNSDAKVKEDMNSNASYLTNLSIKNSYNEDVIQPSSNKNNDNNIENEVLKAKSIDSLPSITSKQMEKSEVNINHYPLCDKFHYNTTSIKELAKNNKNVLANSKDFEKNDNVKGPRFCSVRVQSGSKNILLDNIQNSVSPVLYTHPSDKKHKKLIKTSQSDGNVHQKVFESSALDDRILSNNKLQNSNVGSSSSEERNSITLENEEILQNHQRVSQWIQNNIENGGSSSENSRCDLSKKEVNSDSLRYAAMENNVKKFLFGESQSEFLKKVEIGKQNYQNLRGYNSDKQSNSKKSSRMETAI